MAINAYVFFKGCFLRIEVKNAKRHGIGLAGSIKGLISVVGIIRIFQVTGVFGEPLEGIDLIERRAGLEYVHEGITLVINGFFNYFDGLFPVAGINSGDERSVQSDGDREGIKGF